MDNLDKEERAGEERRKTAEREKKKAESVVQERKFRTIRWV
jgi:hypothetical protein